MVAAKAPPIPGLKFQWMRWKCRRSWYLKMSSDKHSCVVSLRSMAGTVNPDGDLSDPDGFENDVPSATKNEFYAADGTGLGYGTPSGGALDRQMNVGDFIHEKKSFLYVVLTSYDGINWSYGTSLKVAQAITVKYKATGGNAVSDWVAQPNLFGSGNTVFQGDITPKINPADVQAIVGPNVSITIPSSANP